MKTSNTFVLLALLCYSALSAFVAKQSVTVSDVTYSIGNKGNDCGVTRTEDGSTVSWYYTDGAANSDDCVGQNIFAIASDIWVILSVNENQDILTDDNSATGDGDDLLNNPLVGDAIVIGQIDTSSASGTFGKFSYALLNTAVDLTVPWPAPIEYVSAAACDDKETIQLTVNVQSPYGMVDIPFDFIEINGNGAKQVFDTTDQSLKAYEADDAPFCTEVKEPTTIAAEKSSGIAAWKLALIIALPCVAILAAVTIFLYLKIAAKKKAAAATAKIEKFKQLPTSPNTATGAGNAV